MPYCQIPYILELQNMEKQGAAEVELYPFWLACIRHHAHYRKKSNYQSYVAVNHVSQHTCLTRDADWYNSDPDVLEAINHFLIDFKAHSTRQKHKPSTGIRAKNLWLHRSQLLGESSVLLFSHLAIVLSQFPMTYCYTYRLLHLSIPIKEGFLQYTAIKTETHSFSVYRV